MRVIFCFFSLFGCKDIEQRCGLATILQMIDCNDFGKCRVLAQVSSYEVIEGETFDGFLAGSRAFVCEIKREVAR